MECLHSLQLEKLVLYSGAALRVRLSLALVRGFGDFFFTKICPLFYRTSSAVCLHFYTSALNCVSAIFQIFTWFVHLCVYVCTGSALPSGHPEPFQDKALHGTGARVGK